MSRTKNSRAAQGGGHDSKKDRHTQGGYLRLLGGPHHDGLRSRHWQADSTVLLGQNPKRGAREDAGRGCRAQ